MKLYISSICIVLAFFFWKIYAQQEYLDTLANQNTDAFVNLDIKKNKLKVNSSDSNIQILINGEAMSGDTELENVCE